MLLLNACQQPVFLDYEVWILEEGAWNDSGIWKDPSTWDDGGSVAPTVIAVADLAANPFSGSISGVSKTLSQIFEHNADFGAFDPTLVVAGTGLHLANANGADGGQQKTYPAFTSGLVTAVGNAFTMVIEFAMVSSGDAECFCFVVASQLPDGVPYWETDIYRSSGSLAGDTGTSFFDNGSATGSTAAPTSGANKIAITYHAAGIAASINGAAAVNTSALLANACDLSGFVASAYSETGGSADTKITKVTFYAAQDNASLQSLSA